METEEFKKLYMENEMSLEILVGKLRLNKNGDMAISSSAGKIEESGVTASKKDF